MSDVVPTATTRADARRDAAAVYDAFAPFYDTFNAHQDYDWWWSVLLAPVEAAGLSGRRVLDVACGTGRSMVPLLERGFAVTGVDLSRGMLAQAARKLGTDVPLFEHDMRELPQLGEFDLVSCLNDAINYVLDEQQLLDTFRGFRRNLAPGGVVVFDGNTLGTFRRGADCVLAHQQPDRIMIVEEGVGAQDLQPGGTVRQDLVVLELLELYFWRRTTTTNHQRHHPEPEVRRALAAAGLELLEVRGLLGRSLDEACDELVHEKAIYVARTNGEGR